VSFDVAQLVSMAPIPLTIIDGRRVREHPFSHAGAASREST